MTLDKLKTLARQIKNHLTMVGNIEKLKIDLAKLQDLIVEKEGPNSNRFKKGSTYTKATGDYLRDINALEGIYNEINQAIQVAEKNNLQDDDEVDYKIPPDFIQVFNHIQIAGVNFHHEKNKIYQEFQHNNAISLTTKTLSPKKIISSVNDILRATSGEFNLDAARVQLTKSQHTTLDQKGINEGYYKDHGLIDFKGQTLPEINRTDKDASNAALVSQKIEDFVTRYLKVTGLPPKITPNLYAMLSTLGYQSGIPGIANEQLLDVMYFNLGEQGDAMFAASSSSMTHFDFDSHGRIYVNFVARLPDQIGLNIGYKLDANLVQSIDLVIDVTLDNQQNPIFKVNHINQSLSGLINAEKSPGVDWRLHQRGLQHTAMPNKKYFNPLDNLVEHAIKFAGYRSTKDFIKKTNQSSAIWLFSPQFFFSNERRSGQSYGFNKAELAFLENLYNEYHQNNTSNTELAKNILSFFNQQLPTLSSADKVRYVHLLKMASTLAGTLLPEIKAGYVALVKQCASDKPTLIEVLKSSMNAYMTYQRELQNQHYLAFNPLPELSIEEHLSIMNSLEHEHMAFIARHPNVLKENKNYIIFLNQLSFDKKIAFLAYDAKYSFKALNLLDKSFLDASFEENYSLINKLKAGELPELRTALNLLMLRSDLKTLKFFKEKFFDLFVIYNNSWPRTLESTHKRMDLIGEAGKEALGRFGDQFILQILVDLSHMIQTCDSPAVLKQIHKNIVTLTALFLKLDPTDPTVREIFRLLEKTDREVNLKLKTLDVTSAVEKPKTAADEVAEKTYENFDKTVKAAEKTLDTYEKDSAKIVQKSSEPGNFG